MLPTATNVWLEKAEYVHALYPPNCTDDTEIVAGVGEIIRSQSVLGQPTRFTTLDLEYGRSGEHVERHPRAVRQGRHTHLLRLL